MSTITLAIAPSHADFDQILNDDFFTAISGAVQTAARTGNRWGLVLTYKNMVFTRRRQIWAQSVGLAGRRNRLRVDLVGRLKYLRSGTGGGTPLLVGAHLAGVSSLSVDGATATVTNWLGEGDWITIGNQLCMVLTTINSSGGGAATISIWPELHKNYADNTPVEIVSPFGIFMLTEPMALPISPSVYTDRWLSESVILSLEQDVLA